MSSKAPLFAQSLTTTTSVPTCLITTSSHIITGLNDGTVSIIDHELGGQTVLKIGDFAVWSLCFIPSASITTRDTSEEAGFLAVGSSGGGLSLWNLSSNVKVSDLIGHTETIRCLRLLKDGRLVSAGRDNTLRIWSTNFESSDKEAELTLDGHTDTIRDFATYQTSEGNERIISTSCDTTARVWDPSSGICLHVLSGHTSKLFVVTCSQDGKHAATGGMNGEIKVWDLLSNTLIKSLSMLPKDVSEDKRSNILVSKLAFLTIGGKECLLTGDNLGTLKCWHFIGDEKAVWDVQAHEPAVVAMVVDEETGRCITGGSDGKVRAWGLENGILGENLGDGGDVVWKVAALGSGKRVVAAVARQGKVILEVFDLDGVV
jgi:F-box and WD-40 domain protein CDC4